MTKRTTQLPLRVPNDRLDAYSKAAERAGMSRTAWMIAQCDKSLTDAERAKLEPVLERGRRANPTNTD